MAKQGALFMNEDSDSAPQGRLPFDHESNSASSDEGSIFEPDDEIKLEEAIEEDLSIPHCVCRTPSSGLMISCDGPCQTWYHAPCLSLNASDIKAIKDFFCPTCTEAGHGPTTWCGSEQQAKNIKAKVEKQMKAGATVDRLNEWVTRSTYTTEKANRTGGVRRSIARAAPVKQNRGYLQDNRQRNGIARMSAPPPRRAPGKQLPINAPRVYLDSSAEVGVSPSDILTVPAAAGTPSSAAKQRKQAVRRKKLKSLRPIEYSVDGVDVDRSGMKRGVTDDEGPEVMDTDDEEEKKTFTDLVVKEGMEMALFGAVSHERD
ncbi:hypothetical protein TI39_contig331g00003 [Zymoseptoria brevis]|uniref:PHD-type domain-containing protein n=1 Tax=Zymoseptoria brevis TaxID=1047168 RepID=A0A0F4GSK4_9PEZI|nr:hypothetical protein TI39_contig331g00003 [Zymoseptoria brevis]